MSVVEDLRVGSPPMGGVIGGSALLSAVSDLTRTLRSTASYLRNLEDTAHTEEQDSAKDAPPPSNAGGEQETLLRQLKHIESVVKQAESSVQCELSNMRSEIEAAGEKISSISVAPHPCVTALSMSRAGGNDASAGGISNLPMDALYELHAQLKTGVRPGTSPVVGSASAPLDGSRSCVDPLWGDENEIPGQTHLLPTLSEGVKRYLGQFVVWDPLSAYDIDGGAAAAAVMTRFYSNPATERQMAKGTEGDGAVVHDFLSADGGVTRAYAARDYSNGNGSPRRSPNLNDDGRTRVGIRSGEANSSQQSGSPQQAPEQQQQQQQQRSAGIDSQFTSFAQFMFPHYTRPRVPAGRDGGVSFAEESSPESILSTGVRTNPARLPPLGSLCNGLLNHSAMLCRVTDDVILNQLLHDGISLTPTMLVELGQSQMRVASFQRQKDTSTVGRNGHNTTLDGLGGTPARHSHLKPMHPGRNRNQSSVFPDRDALSVGGDLNFVVPEEIRNVLLLTPFRYHEIIGKVGANEDTLQNVGSSSDERASAPGWQELDALPEEMRVTHRFPKTVSWLHHLIDQLPFSDLVGQIDHMQRIHSTADLHSLDPRQKRRSVSGSQLAQQGQNAEDESAAASSTAQNVTVASVANDSGSGAELNETDEGSAGGAQLQEAGANSPIIASPLVRAPLRRSCCDVSVEDGSKNGTSPKVHMSFSVDQWKKYNGTSLDFYIWLGTAILLSDLTILSALQYAARLAHTAESTSKGLMLLARNISILSSVPLLVWRRTLEADICFDDGNQSPEVTKELQRFAEELNRRTAQRREQSRGPQSKGELASALGISTSATDQNGVGRGDGVTTGQSQGVLASFAMLHEALSYFMMMRKSFVEKNDTGSNNHAVVDSDPTAAELREFLALTTPFLLLHGDSLGATTGTAEDGVNGDETEHADGGRAPSVPFGIIPRVWAEVTCADVLEQIASLRRLEVLKWRTYLSAKERPPPHSQASQSSPDRADRVHGSGGGVGNAASTLMSNLSPGATHTLKPLEDGPVPRCENHLHRVLYPLSNVLLGQLTHLENASMLEVLPKAPASVLPASLVFRSFPPPDLTPNVNYDSDSVQSPVPSNGATAGGQNAATTGVASTSAERSNWSPSTPQGNPNPSGWGRVETSLFPDAQRAPYVTFEHPSIGSPSQAVPRIFSSSVGRRAPGEISSEYTWAVSGDGLANMFSQPPEGMITMGRAGRLRFTSRVAAADAPAAASVPNGGGASSAQARTALLLELPYARSVLEKEAKIRNLLPLFKNREAAAVSSRALCPSADSARRLFGVVTPCVNDREMERIMNDGEMTPLRNLLTPMAVNQRSVTWMPPFRNAACYCPVTKRRCVDLSICSDPKSPSYNPPKLLVCGHIVSHKAVTELTVSSRNEPYTPTVRCPYCRSNSAVPSQLLTIKYVF